MDDLPVPPAAEPPSPPDVGEARAVDLSALEKIEAELAAVERALVQIDEGVYEGFEGIDGGEQIAENAGTQDIGAPSVSG